MKEESPDEVQATQLGLHSIRQLLGHRDQTVNFSDQDRRFAKEYGVELENVIERFGMDLTDMQSRVMEAILHGFSLTRYQGNLKALSTEALAEEKYAGKVPPAYKHVRQLPRLRITQSEILQFAGVDRSNGYNWPRAIQAINALGTKQYCFYYDRLALNEQGTPIKSKDGNWKKEEVVTVDTLFTIQEVQDGATKYYDITPSVVFLDQRETYFLWIPRGWRDEVRQLYGNKKASSYTFRFLMFLRYQYELKRRSPKQKPPYVIRWSPERIANELRMPPSVYLRKKRKALEILEDAYSVAKKLAYLSDYRIHENTHVLILNDGKFCIGQPLTSFSTIEQKRRADAQELFTHFYDLRRNLDPQHVVPSGSQMSTDVLILTRLLETRSKSQIQQLMSWSAGQLFWRSRLSTIGKLGKSFDDAIGVMLLEQQQQALPEVNRKLAFELASAVESQGLPVVLEVLNGWTEVLPSSGVTRYPFCLKYDDKRFRAKLITELERYGFQWSTGPNKRS